MPKPRAVIPAAHSAPNGSSMADASNITVAIERVIHTVLRDSIQRIYDLHGIRVSSLSVRWYDRSTIEKEAFDLKGIEAVTHSGRTA